MEEDLNTILHRQQIFCSSLKSYFFRKITKYQNVLLKSGVQLSDQGCDDNFNSLPRNQSFEEHIELVIGQKTASPNVYKTFLKIGNRISTLKLFRWIYLLVQRTKAARVLHHLDGVAEEEIKTVINSVGQEISVAFEYQLCLLDGESEIVKLAQHAGACMFTYLNSKEAEYTPENLLQAVLEVKPQSGNNKEILKTRTISINNCPVCLRWKLSQVFKQPGLRTTLNELDDGVKGISFPSTKTDDSADDEDENLDGNSSNNPDLQQSAGAVGSTKSKIELDREKYDELGKETRFARAEALFVESNQKRTKTRRRINEIDMDFDKDVMTITEHSVKASDFSSIGNQIFNVEGDDSTSIEEEINSETYFAGKFTENIGISAISPDNTPQGNTKVLIEEQPKNLDCLNNVWTSHHVQINEEMKNIEFNENSDTVTNVTLYNEKVDSTENSNINISAETPRPQCDTFDTRINLVDIQNAHVEKDVFFGQTSDFERHTAHNMHPHDNDIHINSNINTKVDTYQADININSIVSAESMPNVATVGKSYVFYGCFTPYGAKCRPKIYGYRGPLHIWNEERRNYSLIYNDTVTVARKQLHDSLKPQLIFHQRYIPKTVCRH